MPAGVEEMVEVVPVVASGVSGRGAAVVGVAAEGAQPMMRMRRVCRYRQKLRSPYGFLRIHGHDVDDVDAVCYRLARSH
jgi:hypothetical protein